MRCYLILPYTNIYPEIESDAIYVGVDRGSINALNYGMKLDYAIGDFDSISKSEYEYLEKNVQNIIKLPENKDLTDTAYAIDYFQKYDEIIVYGGINGKRVDHFIANINLVSKYPNVVFIDEMSYIKSIPMGTTKIFDTYKYYSFFAEKGSILSLDGFLYPLTNYEFKQNDSLCISNELISNEGTITFSGSGIMVLSKADR